MQAGIAQGRINSPAPFSLYVNNMPSLFHHVELALYVEDTVILATSCQQALIVKYLETYLSDLEQWLRKWSIAINVSKSTTMLFVKAGRSIPKPRPVQLFGDPIHSFDTARYLGVTLYAWLTWSTHVDQVRKKAAQRPGVLGTLLNRRSGLSIRNGVMMHKQLIGPMMNYVCPVWRSAACSHTRKLQVLQSKCLRIVTIATWYMGNKQVHKDLGVPFFTYHHLWEVRLKVSWCGEPLSYAAQQISMLTEHWPGCRKARRSGSTTCMATRKRQPCRQTESWPSGTLSAILTEVLSVLFSLSCKVNARV